MAPRRREIPAEGSWRLVDGENDSFDTSIIDPLPGDDFSPPSSAMPSSGFPTQESFSQSQNNMSFASQDSIRDFANFQNDEDVILRQPFRPTLPSSAATSMQRASYPQPELQLRMPLVKANNLVASEASRTARTTDDDSEEGSVWDSEQEQAPDNWHEESEKEYARLLKEQNEASVNWGHTKPGSSASSPSWQLLQIFRYTIIPVAIVLVAYLFHINGVSVQDARDKVQSFSFTSLQDITGVSNFQIPFFEAETSHRAAASSIDFTSLMEVQSGFESVLDKSAYGLTMPLELKSSEMATRNLRALLKETEIAAREDFILELNGYIEKAGRAGSDLQTFYIHIGSTVDSIININRWTLRHINSLSMEPETPSLPPVIAWAIRPLSLFRSSEQAGNDQALLDKYSEHITLVQDRLGKLLDEGKALLLLLHQSQSQLGVINEQAKQLPGAGSAKPDSLLSTIWAYIGSFMEEPRNFDEQIVLLKKVDAQYANTISHLVSLIEELKDIQLYLGDLLKRNDDSSDIWEEGPGALGQTTLSEQYDIIKNAVERLEQARKRTTEGEAENKTPSEAELETPSEAETETPSETEHETSGETHAETSNDN
ncbi:uncharacterized protein TRIVIDRAFT_32745 [Trichoderma virens Gv29-8]|uniref:Uncharacterized protein n=1 Tax=Hypocrea virens (strain Gv29-8 / FGSC 10586) TaxID=413071 RepID=G9MI62_HYPVG|nr:uncharacterized protein TRIVIDRAFT_32745 [Trichoderma virens Gv29-8]EHK25179.1 hypothetical protein TRIVIDRAFT_32745 [Trichoderma virens Gv29-8]UKZ48995.1 hypothetical protein TrVGV298_003233 [Trichoderma virens]